MSNAQPVDATTDETYNVPTPEELRLLRRDAGVTQTQLANAIGSTQTTISQFEVGNHDILAATLRDAVDHLNEVINGDDD